MPIGGVNLGDSLAPTPLSYLDNEVTPIEHFYYSHSLKIGFLLYKLQAVIIEKQSYYYKKADNILKYTEWYTTIVEFP